MRTVAIITLMLLSALMASCNSEPSLQKYFVQKTEDKNFIALDLNSSMLNANQAKLSAEQKQALASFEKINILAFKLDATNVAAYNTEKAKVNAILKDQKYQRLMSFGSGQDGASLSFVGDENHIDEFILMGNSKGHGFAVVRVLGKDMNPTGIMTMLSVLKDSNINMDQLKPLEGFINKK
ncbi:MAG TPA: DUF4252 domain-containing protein [Flavobacterium sp.]|jgi:hypothetical protein